MSTDYSEDSYGQRLTEIAKDYPAVAGVLGVAHRLRTERLTQYKGGRRLAGFEELLEYCSQLEAAYAAQELLKSLSFLITRCRSDLIIAFESTLSAAPSVVADAMRDLMEIEILLREFRYESAQIKVWLSTDEQTRRNKFSPGVLRRRYAQRLQKNPGDLPESFCYKLHSQLLHVTPAVSPLGSRGIGVEQHPFALDLCFGELFEHARRILFEAFDLLKAVATDNLNVSCPRAELPKASEAWISTQVMLGVSLAVLAGANAKRSGSLEDAHSYDTEHLSFPAAIGFHYFLRALELTDKDKVFDGEAEVPRSELLALAVSVCGEEAKKEMPHW